MKKYAFSWKKANFDESSAKILKYRFIYIEMPIESHF